MQAGLMVGNPELEDGRMMPGNWFWLMMQTRMVTLMLGGMVMIDDPKIEDD